MRERLREILYFFRTNFGALLALTLPFAVAGALLVHVLGQPATFVEGKEPDVNPASAIPLALLQPLMLAVQIAGVHQLAAGGRLSAGPLLRHALRAWPAVFVVSIPLGLAALGVVSVLFAVPAAWLYARLGLSPILAVVEAQGPFRALANSWRRTEENQYELFLLVMLMGGLLLVVLLLLSQALKAGAAADSMPADMAVRTLIELLLSLLTIGFYRQWTLRKTD